MPVAMLMLWKLYYAKAYPDLFFDSITSCVIYLTLQPVFFVCYTISLGISGLVVLAFWAGFFVLQPCFSGFLFQKLLYTSNV